MTTFRGVVKQKDGRYIAKIGAAGSCKYLGYFREFEEAKAARLAAEVALFGRVFDRRDPEISGDVVRIPLHGQRGVFKGWALVDVLSMPRVEGIAWTTDPRGYVVGRPPGLGAPVTLHRWLMPNAACVDHRNGDRLDNRRENLRECTQAENSRNTRLSANNTSGAKGVTPVPGGKWRARIWFDWKEIHLGAFATRDEAAQAYDRAAAKLHGEFASPNASAHGATA